MIEESQTLQTQRKNRWTVGVGLGVLFAIPLTILLNIGLEFVIYYFRLSYTWGLGGIFVPIAILFYSFFSNIILVIALSIILRKRALRFVFLAAFFINLIFLGVIFGYYTWKNWEGFSKLSQQRHNDRWVDAKTISDCGTLTDYNYWSSCADDKIKTQEDYEICIAQANNYEIPTSRGGKELCLIKYAAVIRNPELCNEISNNLIVEDKKSCVAEVVLHSPTETWGDISPKLIDGCLKVNDPFDKNFCLVASLRQVNKDHPLVEKICAGIDPQSWFYENVDPKQDPNGDRARVKDYCGIEIPVDT